MEAEEGASLMEEWRVAGVEVLRLSFAHDAAPEGHDAAPGIVYGDGEAVAEEVYLGAAVAAAGQSRLFQQLAGEVQAAQVVDQGVPGIRRHAEAGLGHER